MMTRKAIHKTDMRSDGFRFRGFYACAALAIFGRLAIGVAAAAPSNAPRPELPAAGGGNATAMTDIHDIKPVLDLGSGLNWQAWALGVAAFLGVLAVAWWLWKRRQSPEIAAPAVAAISPEQEAYQALDALATETGVCPKHFYFRLSAVVRHYMERRFQFPAAEMTTEELLPRVDRLPLNQRLAGELKTFCRASDPIKFAGAPARRQQMPHDLAFARDFVRQTTAAQPPETGKTPKTPTVSTSIIKNPEPLGINKEITWNRK